MTLHPPEKIGWPWRRLRLPHFLGLGTQKGGTTSLQKLLEQHPGVYLPPCKEVQYFSLHAEKSASWYSEHYRDARRGQQRGDITPFYLFHPDVPARIRALLPKARMIVLLRDPVERTLSQVFHAQRHGFERLNIEDALEAEKERLSSGSAYNLQKHSYVARSRYAEQLDRYEMLFPKKQLLVLKSEDLFNNTAEAWGKIQDFLKINITDLPSRVPRANAGNGESFDIDPRIRKKLRARLQETTEEINKRYGIDWGW